MHRHTNMFRIGRGAKDWPYSEIIVRQDYEKDSARIPAKGLPKHIINGCLDWNYSMSTSRGTLNLAAVITLLIKSFT